MGPCEEEAFNFPQAMVVQNDSEFNFYSEEQRHFFWGATQARL